MENKEWTKKKNNYETKMRLARYSGLYHNLEKKSSFYQNLCKIVNQKLFSEISKMYRAYDVHDIFFYIKLINQKIENKLERKRFFFLIFF